MPNESEFMTIEEFAALPSAAQHAVWAAGEARIDTIRVNAGDIRRWHRAQVAELLKAGRVAAR